MHLLKFSSRATTHIRRLLDLIAQFPHDNRSMYDTDIDILKLFRQIRSRYKALCATLGVRPSLRYSERSQDRDEVADASVSEQEPRPKSGSVWKIDNASRKPVTGHAFDF